jgi:hypothetical protein
MWNVSLCSDSAGCGCEVYVYVATCMFSICVLPEMVCSACAVDLLAHENLQ